MSVLSQVVSASGKTTGFSGQGAKVSVPPRQAGWTNKGSSVSHRSAAQMNHYNYGPSSTSASIAASSTSGRRQASLPTVNYGPYKALNAPKVPQAIAYHKEDRPESALSVRHNVPTPSVVYIGNGRGTKVAPRIMAKPPGQPSQSDQGKFFQISGLKVRKEFSANQKNNGTTENKPVLALMPARHESRSSSSESTPSSSHSVSPEPYVHARVPTQFTQSDDKLESRSPSPTDYYANNRPKSFYSSLVGSKGFSLSLASKREQPPQLGPLRVPSNPSSNSHGSYHSDSESEVEADISAEHAPENPAESVNLQVKQARSDRKIMDLEISNASLMAVNKYLEKKLRSQAKDIQYLKVSNENLIPGQVSETESEDDASDDELENTHDDDQTAESTNQSPEEIELTEKTKLIEQRMQSHIKFLESSEKVNKMMRHCLMITDSLLQQANKSLEYEVDPLDVKYGLQVSNHAFINEASETSFDNSFSEGVEDELLNESLSELEPVDYSRPILDGIIEEENEDQ